MSSIRGRLTATYAAALTGTILVFGGVLWLGRGAVIERDLQRYAATEAQTALDLAGAVRAQGGAGKAPVPLVEPGDATRDPRVSDALKVMLEPLPDIVMFFDRAGYRVYASREVRFLSYNSVQYIQASAPGLRSHIGRTQIVRDTLDSLRMKAWRARGLPLSEDVLLVRAEAADTLAPIAYVVAGTSLGPMERAQRELLGTMLALAPFVILVSIAVAYYMAGDTLRPLEQMRAELEAITDGRSLHRRLHVETSGDELARLAATLNEMIGRLETSFAGLRRFTADASHELKTPLTVLRANVERAMSVPHGSSEQLVALEEALQEITRMADLVDSLLTLARFDEGRFDLHREPVELEPLVHDVFETAVILGEAARLQIALPVCEQATVLGDAARLRQLFLNLVTNAIKYTPAGGSVELSLRRTEETVEFGVRDSGIGIAAADLPFIFERFWRADRARSRRVLGEPGAGERGGFGLGLAISQWIAQAHGGTLAVTSRLTRGTTFTVTLPLVGEAVQLTSPAAPVPVLVAHEAAD